MNVQHVSLHNRQRKVRINLDWLGNFARHALAICCDQHSSETFQMLSHIEVTIISDDKMTELHKRLLGESKTTDVLSFDYGEIVISADTAAANAQEYERQVEEEIGLYIVHGLLHLIGYDDKHIPERREMQTAQERVYNLCVEQMRQARQDTYE